MARRPVRVFDNTELQCDCNEQAREMLDTALPGPYTTAASETSLLWMLLQQASAASATVGGPTFVIFGKGGAQDARPVGGMDAIYRPNRRLPGRCDAPAAAGAHHRSGR